MKRKPNKRRSKNIKIKRRNKKKRNISRISNKTLLKISLMLFVLSLVYLVCSSIKLPELPVRDIRFEGLGHLDHMELLGKINISKDTNLLDVDLMKMREKLLDEPRIKDAEVSRNFYSGTISIKLQLRIPVALISSNGIYGIDREGVVIDGEYDFPLITGLGISEIKTGMKLTGAKLELAFEVLDYVYSSNLESFASLSEISVGKPKNVVLFVGKEGMQIRLGRGNLEKKINKASAVMADLNSKGEKAYYLDLRFGENRVIVKPKK